MLTKAETQEHRASKKRSVDEVSDKNNITSTKPDHFLSNDRKKLISLLNENFLK